MRYPHLAQGDGNLPALVLSVYIKGRGGGVVLFLEVGGVGGSACIHREKPWRYDAGREIVFGNSTAVCLGGGDFSPWTRLGNGVGLVGGARGKKSEIKSNGD